MDGEGTIMVRKLEQERGRRPFVSVSNTSEQLIDFLVEQIGGRKYRIRVEVCPADCTENHLHTRKQAFQWDIGGERAAILLENIESHMIVKRDKAKDAIHVWRTRTTSLRGAVERVMRDMAARGWVVPYDAPEHGEYRHYNAGCRCDPCRAANAAYSKESRERRRKPPAPRQCENEKCGKTFVYPAEQSNRQTRFCSRQCRFQQWQRNRRAAAHIVC